MRKALKLAVGLATLPLIATGLSACSSSSASTASCAFVVGDGSSGHDAKLHKVLYPGQTVDVGQSENVSYVPCNSRNYITNDGSVKNANGDKIGDRFVPTVAYTSTGVQIKIWTTAYWTLNESKDALSNFYTLCFKYTCASKNDEGGSTDFSTKGWNGMLGENFGPSIDAAAAKSAFQLDDTIWQKHDPNQYDALAKAMSADFANIVRAKTGFSQDLFCGSGNSGWKDPNSPGKGNFTCTPVRITVDKVERGDVNSSDGTTGAAALNAQRLANAKAIYGDSAQYWLGLQDSISQCKSSNVTCVFNIGGTGGAVAVPVPASTPTPVSSPTPSATKK